MSRPPSSILLGFPGSCYHPDWELITWHPTGVLDDKLLDEIAAFAEIQERVAKAPLFHRYTDLSGLTQIRLMIGHVFKVAKRRRSVNAGRPPVKSAIFSDKTVGLGIARMYESLMAGSEIQVRAFYERAAAADWLEVPASALSPAP